MTKPADTEAMKAAYNRLRDEHRHAEKVLEECEIEIECSRIDEDSTAFRTQSHLRNDTKRDLQRIESELRGLDAQLAWPWAKPVDKRVVKPQSFLCRLMRRVRKCRS